MSNSGRNESVRVLGGLRVVLQTIHISRFLLRRSGEVNWGQIVKQTIIKTLTPTENDNSQK